MWLHNTVFTLRQYFHTTSVLLRRYFHSTSVLSRYFITIPCAFWTRKLWPQRRSLLLKIARRACCICRHSSLSRTPFLALSDYRAVFLVRPLSKVRQDLPVASSPHKPWSQQRHKHTFFTLAGNNCAASARDKAMNVHSDLPYLEHQFPKIAHGSHDHFRWRH